MKGWLKFIDDMNDWAGKVLSFLVIAMLGILMLEVVLRYVFNSPTFWAHETSSFLFGAYFLLGGGYVLRHRAHINMDMLYNRFSLRKKAIVDLVFSWLFFLFCGVMLWQGGEMARSSLMAREVSQSSWGPPLYPLKLTIPLAALLILLQGLAKFIRDLTTAITGRAAE